MWTWNPNPYLQTFWIHICFLEIPGFLGVFIKESRFCSYSSPDIALGRLILYIYILQNKKIFFFPCSFILSGEKWQGVTHVLSTTIFFKFSIKIYFKGGNKVLIWANLIALWALIFSSENEEIGLVEFQSAFQLTMLSHIGRRKYTKIKKLP